MISVVIPTFNRAKTLKRSIMSVLDQGELIREIIVIDDNSSDNTKDIIENLKCDKIIYFKSNCKLGACGARNKGIELSTGKYIAFHDSDDVWHKDKIQKQVQYLNEFDIVCSGYNQYSELGVRYVGRNIDDSNIYLELLSENFIGTPTIIGKSKCFKVRGFDTKIPRFQDWDFMLSAAKEYKIKFINEPLVNAYIQENSISKDNKKAIEAMEIIIQKNKESLIKNKNILEKYYRRMGLYELDTNGEYKKYFFKAFKINKSLRSSIDYFLSVLGMKNMIDKIHKR